MGGEGGQGSKGRAGQPIPLTLTITKHTPTLTYPYPYTYPYPNEPFCADRREKERLRDSFWPRATLPFAPLLLTYVQRDSSSTGLHA